MEEFLRFDTAPYVAMRKPLVRSFSFDQSESRNPFIMDRSEKFENILEPKSKSDQAPRQARGMTSVSMVEPKSKSDQAPRQARRMTSVSTFDLDDKVHSDKKEVLLDKLYF
jgi:hypothetical protein